MKKGRFVLPEMCSLSIVRLMKVFIGMRRNYERMIANCRTGCVKWLCVAQVGATSGVCDLLWATVRE